jgi:hypothetical protein
MDVLKGHKYTMCAQRSQIWIQEITNRPCIGVTTWMALGCQDCSYIEPSENFWTSLRNGITRKFPFCKSSFSLLSYSRLMRSTSCLCVRVSPTINFWLAEPICMVYISWHLSPSQRRTSQIPPISLCVCMCILPPIFSRRRLGKVYPSRFFVINISSVKKNCNNPVFQHMTESRVQSQVILNLNLRSLNGT